jgi:spermidine synthase
MSPDEKNATPEKIAVKALPSIPQLILSLLQPLLKLKRIDERKMRGLILLCFFTSGACGLVYEVAWLRVMGLIFGNTTFATSTVLAGYMAGLGLGALWWGKRIDRGGDPVKIYARLEAGIGIYALLTPFIWKLIDLLTIGFFRFISPSFFTALVFKFTIAFSALLFPTFLMGATLPVLSKYFVQKDEEVAKQVGLLYGLNTFGAVLGVLFSGFIALQTFGVWQTVYLTGVLNFVIFYLCRYYEAIVKPIASIKEKIVSAVSDPIAAAFSPAVTRMLLTLFAISGAVSMMYEIAWTRVLAMSLGSSVYAFCIMLATFLLGISIGSYLFSRIPRSIPVGLHTFAAFQGLTALTAILGINIFNDMPYYFVRIFALTKGSDLLLHFGKFFLCSIVMLPPTLCIGAMFSCFIHVLRRSQPLGKEIGEAYFANTIGTILGSVLTGFCIIPLFGIQNTLLLGAGLSAVIGFLAFFLDPKNPGWKHYAILGLAILALVFSAYCVKPWNRGLISSDLAVKPERGVGLSKEQILRSLQERNLLFYKEGLSATVTITKLRDNLSLSVNGKVDASNQDNFTQVLLGHLPMALHPDPKKVLIIGLGSGSTAAAVAAYPVEKIDAVELEQAVIESAKYFHVLNRDLLKDPRVHFHVNDGRNFSLLNPEKYDVIISEPSNPWMAGVANLFSIEHYKTVQKRLAPGGIVCQWFHAYSMSQDDLRMIVRTFSEVFPDTSLWTSYYPDLMLIGKNEPLTLDMKTFEKAFAIPIVREDLKPYGIENAAGFISNAVLFDGTLRVLARAAKINSDNHPYLEFSAPRNLYKNTLRENFMLINFYRNLNSFPDIRNLQPPIEKNAVFYNAMARGYLAKRFFDEAEAMLAKSRAIDPDNPETLLLDGLFYFQSNLKTQAREAFTKVVAKDPKSALATYFLGVIFLDEGQILKAIELFHKASDLEPKNANYFIALFNAYQKINQDEPALKYLTKALEIQPDDFDSWIKKTLLIVKTASTFEKKKQALTDLLKRYPSFSQGYEWLGDILEKNGRHAEAFEVYEDMTDLFPTEAMAYIGLARTSDLLGRHADVKKYVRLAMRYDPSLRKNLMLQKLLRSP